MEEHVLLFDSLHHIILVGVMVTLAFKSELSFYEQWIQDDRLINNESRCEPRSQGNLEMNILAKLLWLLLYHEILKVQVHDRHLRERAMSPKELVDRGLHARDKLLGVVPLITLFYWGEVEISKEFSKLSLRIIKANQENPKIHPTRIEDKNMAPHGLKSIRKRKMKIRRYKKEFLSAPSSSSSRRSFYPNVGKEFLSGSPLVLRVPFSNHLPNKYVRAKEVENRGKYSKYKERKELERLENAGIRKRNSGYYMFDNCNNCLSPADDYFVRTPEHEVVCRNCGAVQCDEKCIENSIQAAQKLSTGYKKRVYLCERLRQSGNLEPRIVREDILLIGQVYSELESSYCKVIDTIEEGEERNKALRKLGLEGWFIEHPGDITKDFVKTLLSAVDLLSPAVRNHSYSFKKKYTERWLQIKIFFCGESYFKNYVSKLPDYELLTKIFFLSNEIADVYENKRAEAKIFTEKKSIPSLDLMMLLVLYNISPDDLDEFGWYYQVKAPESDSSRRDFETLVKILEYLNSQYKKQGSSRNSRIKTAKDYLGEGEWTVPESIHRLLQQCHQ